MFATNNDYEEAIRGSSIHSYEHSRESKKKFFTKLLSLATTVGLLYIGFDYYQKLSLQKSQNLLDNTLLTKKVLEISSEESIQEESLQNKLDEDEYLSALKHSSDITVQDVDNRDEYLVALESMEVDVLDDFQPKNLTTSPISKAIETTNLNQMDLGEAISNLVDESVVNNSNYTNELKKEIIAKNSSKG